MSTWRNILHRNVPLYHKQIIMIIIYIIVSVRQYNCVKYCFPRVRHRAYSLIDCAKRLHYRKQRKKPRSAHSYLWIDAIKRNDVAERIPREESSPPESRGISSTLNRHGGRSGKRFLRCFHRSRVCLPKPYPKLLHVRRGQ